MTTEPRDLWAGYKRRICAGGDGDAGHALEAVVDALRDVLTPDEAALVSRYLPEDLGEILRSGAGRLAPGGGLEEVVRGVAWRENVERERALEHVTAACDEIATLLPDEIRSRLAADLPRDLASLFSPTSLPYAQGAGGSLERTPLSPERSTLSSGRPGSRHPVASSAPPDAQSESVVRQENPHGDTKLSSARGTTQERLAETLAAGRPGPPRPVSGSSARAAPRAGARSRCRS